MCILLPGSPAIGEQVEPTEPRRKRQAIASPANERCRRSNDILNGDRADGREVRLVERLYSVVRGPSLRRRLSQDELHNSTSSPEPKSGSAIIPNNAAVRWLNRLSRICIDQTRSDVEMHAREYVLKT